LGVCVPLISSLSVPYCRLGFASVHL
jgi:hypothetical protein